MAGHSHWAGIKHKKAATDRKRSKLWSKLSKAIIVAAKLGGGDPDANARLRNAIQEAKSLSLPKENIERAIKRGIGELDGDNVEEILYEGYGPAGVAVLCEIMTDNRNRTAPEIRKTFDVYGGSLGATGCVGYLFERKGILTIVEPSPESGITEERIVEVAMEQSAEDVATTDDGFEILCAPESLSALADAFTDAGITADMNRVVRIPSMTVDVDENVAPRILKLLEALEDHDDVQNISTNLNFSHPPVAKLLNQ